MKKYVIATALTTVYRIVVEANTKDEAIELVYAGDYPEEYNEPVECLNEEIISVEELSEDD